MRDYEPSRVESAVEFIGMSLILYGLCHWAFSHKQKEVVRENQDFTCADCGIRSQRSFEVHHIQPQCMGGKDTLDNAIGLCGPKANDCHEKWDKKALEEGVLWDGREIDVSRKCKSQRAIHRIKRKLKRRRRR